MLKYFRTSLIVTIMGFIIAWLWAENHIGAGLGPKILFITFFLAILEITLSFDNAVVNALILGKMTPKWQHRFLTWGIIIAVFGMRLLFPVLIVSVFSGLNIIDTFMLAVEDVKAYEGHLQSAHAPLMAFGSSFLMMVGLSYFFGEIEHKWIKPIENLTEKLKGGGIDTALALVAICAMLKLTPKEHLLDVGLSGLFGIILFIIIKDFCSLLEEKQAKSVKQGVATGGFMMFLYLEILDASFSLDGVLGAFAISKDIIVIMIGLAIGAMFVRSLTIFFVEQKTLKEYAYLSSGAHYAILALAAIMLISVKYHISEIITGCIGLICVGGAFLASVIENKKTAHTCRLEDNKVECD